MADAGGVSAAGGTCQAEPNHCAPASQKSTSGKTLEAELDDLVFDESDFENIPEADPWYEKDLARIRAQQRDRNERDHNEHLQRNTYADTLELQKRFHPGDLQDISRKGRDRNVWNPSDKIGPRTKAAHEARDERIRNAASRQYDINNSQEDDYSMEDQRGVWNGAYSF